MRVLDEAQWRGLASAYEASVGPLIEPRLTRRLAGRSHPVDDFLFEYYAYRPGQLRRWHPGADVVLCGGAADYRGLRGYETVGGDALAPIAGLAPHRTRLDSVIDLLARTHDRPPQFGCFGRHEWAMVFCLDQDEIRHSTWPLRLTVEQISEVVTASPLACTHFDAFRFYTDAARPLNVMQPTRATQAAHEQPGCLHAGMDLYKWAFMFSPWVAAQTVLECFVLSREIRDVDMRVAPYDLSELGFTPIEIETAAGRAQFADLQRGFSDRQQTLRVHLLDELTRLRDGLRAAGDARRHA